MLVAVLVVGTVSCGCSRFTISRQAAGQFRIRWWCDVNGERGARSCSRSLRSSCAPRPEGGIGHHKI